MAYRWENVFFQNRHFRRFSLENVVFSMKNSYSQGLPVNNGHFSTSNLSKLRRKGSFFGGFPHQTVLVKDEFWSYLFTGWEMCLISRVQKGVLDLRFILHEERFDVRAREMNIRFRWFFHVFHRFFSDLAGPAVGRPGSFITTDLMLKRSFSCRFWWFPHQTVLVKDEFWPYLFTVWGSVLKFEGLEGHFWPPFYPSRGKIWCTRERDEYPFFDGFSRFPQFL
jgi:hypothetical protein